MYSIDEPKFLKILYFSILLELAKCQQVPTEYLSHQNKFKDVGRLKLQFRNQNVILLMIKNIHANKF